MAGGQARARSTTVVLPSHERDAVARLERRDEGVDFLLEESRVDRDAEALCERREFGRSALLLCGPICDATSASGTGSSPDVPDPCAPFTK